MSVMEHKVRTDPTWGTRMEIAISVGEGRGLVHRNHCIRVAISMPGYLCGGLAPLFGGAVAP
jgi:hypothetical protein